MKMIAGSILVLSSAVFTNAAVLCGEQGLSVLMAIAALILFFSGVWELNKGVIYEDDEQRMRKLKLDLDIARDRRSDS